MYKTYYRSKPKLYWLASIITQKAYWSIINRNLNKKNIPNIPPLLVNNKLVSDFHKKVKLFNQHFAEQLRPSSKYKHATSFQL